MTIDHGTGGHGECQEASKSVREVVTMRWLARLHGVGLNAALVVGLALMPAVIAVSYWTGHAADGGAGLAPLRLRGTFSGVEESRATAATTSPSDAARGRPGDAERSNQASAPGVASHKLGRMVG